MNCEGEMRDIILRQRPAWVALILVVVHQSIVAGSTFFLTDVIARFQGGQPYASSLYLYLAMMIIPYLPGSASFIFLQRWINASHRAFVDSFTTKMLGSIGKYRSEGVRERVTAVLARNSFAVIKDYVTYIHDLTSFALNSMLSMMVIAMLLPTRLMWGYFASLALCFLMVAWLRERISTASSDCESRQLNYSDVLDKSWANLTVGNAYNRTLWHEQKEAAAQSFYSAGNQLQLYRQLGNLLLAAASLLPTISLVVAIVVDQTTGAEVIAALIVSLTRVFLILNALSTLVYKALDLSSMRARINVLLHTGRMLATTDDDVPGKIGDIRINGLPVTCMQQVLDMLSASGPGRFTITGLNGSGKSTALLALKKALGEECFLLPVEHADLMWKSKGLIASTGQRICVYLDEIFGAEKIRYIFLDEWNANLDGVNTRKIDARLDELSKSRTIVEVRHLVR